MQVSIDRLGRVVVPKPIREKLSLKGGERLDIREYDGVIELRPVPLAVRIVDGPHGAVAEPLGDVPPLTDELVRETLDQIRR